jgi:pseudouridine-5'-phosphate glycosidase
MIKIAEHIKKALDNGLPVVALESTIISHGLPYPDNIEVAKKLESIIIKQGAIPATIAIIEGVIKVGLDDHDLDILSKETVVKVSKRDMGYVISKKLHGATTVSATVLIASLVGIKVFATGGIGGVHKYAQETFDISRDLLELAEHNLCVISAGAKSILDLELTLEYLETQGVEVVGFKTDYLPSFYARTSPYKLSMRLDTEEEVAKLLHAKWTLGIKGGVVLANPIPEAYALDEDIMKAHIDKALEKSKLLGIKGKETTPFLLKEIKEITDGKSLEANKALVYHNAFVAANIAKYLSQLSK